jgi:hypothetical protein
MGLGGSNITSNEDIYEWLLQRDDKFLIDMQNFDFARKKFGKGARGVVAKDIARQILREREQMRQYAVAVAQAQAKQPAPAPAPTPVVPTPTPSPAIIYTTKPAPQQIIKVQQTVTPVVQKVTPVTPPAPQQILYVPKPAVPTPAPAKPSWRERIAGIFKRLKFW